MPPQTTNSARRHPTATTAARSRAGPAGRANAAEIAERTEQTVMNPYTRSIPRIVVVSPEPAIRATTIATPRPYVSLQRMLAIAPAIPNRLGGTSAAPAADRVDTVMPTPTPAKRLSGKYRLHGSADSVRAKMKLAAPTAHDRQPTKRIQQRPIWSVKRPVYGEPAAASNGNGANAIPTS